AVSRLFAQTLAIALAAAAETEGLVDPTMGVAIEAAGYTRDFAVLCDDGPPGEPVPGWWGAVVVGPRLVQLPPGTKLDLNGVVKSAAVDDALELLSGSAFVS